MLCHLNEYSVMSTLYSFTFRTTFRTKTNAISDDDYEANQVTVFVSYEFLTSHNVAH
jgi:hypothetical protein